MRYIFQLTNDDDVAALNGTSGENVRLFGSRPLDFEIR